MSYQASMVTKMVEHADAFKSVTDGAFAIQIDTVLINIVGLDFSGISGYDDIAAIIQSAIRAEGVGGFTNAVVEIIKELNQVILFKFTSGTNQQGSYVSTLYSPISGSGTDVSSLQYLNGQSGNMILELSIYLVDAEDIASINSNNAAHANTLSVMIFYNLNTDQQTGQCIEQDIIEMPAYQDWWDDLNSITPFSARTAINIKIDNN